MKESGTDIDQVLICQPAGLGLGLGSGELFCLAKKLAQPLPGGTAAVIGIIEY